jgi:hypothetical protein
MAEDRIQFIGYVSTLLSGIAIGIIFGAVLSPSGDFTTGQSTYPLTLTSTQLSSYALQTFTTQPLDVQLRIASDPVFKSEAIAKDTDAYTFIQAHPCRIVIPAGWKIEYIPMAQYAYWERPFNGDTIAHELLHCYLGNWHAEWTKIHGK